MGTFKGKIRRLDPERVLGRFPVPVITRIWMEGNLAWFVSVLFWSGMLFCALILSYLFPFFWFYVFSLICFVKLAITFLFSGLKRGFLVKPVHSLSSDTNSIIALTFDDGPNKGCTPKILDILKAHDVRASFFLVGEQMLRYPDIAARISGDGHDLGNHGFSHTPLDRKPMKELEDEVNKTQAMIKRYRNNPPLLFRPPHGRRSLRLEWVLKRLGAGLVHWNLSPKDWKAIPDDVVLDRLVRYTKSGTIVLLHDTPTAVKVLPAYIQKMKKKGFQFVTLTEIMET